MSLPNWVGTEEVYRKLNKILEEINAASYKAFLSKKRKKSEKWHPSEEVREVVEAMSKGDEEYLKHVLAFYTINGYFSSN